MKVVVGLGNPDKQYEKTRHNVGWIFLDYLNQDADWKHEKKFNSLVYKKGDFIFVKPLTYMNNSGEAVSRIMNYYNLIPKKLKIFSKKNQDLSKSLLVIHDELDLDFGKMKISINSGSAGHKGISSIINHLKTKNFTRMRIGIKNEMLKTKIPPDKFVLQKFSVQELEGLEKNVFNYQINDLFN